jgi:hypothetical protein
MKPNCSNCPYWINRFQDALHECPARYSYGIRFYEENFIPFTEKVGCLSHPGAREYLMKDVIQELERQAVDARRFKNHERVAGYEKAISLLKGVKE